MDREGPRGPGPRENSLRTKEDAQGKDGLTKAPRTL
jgi:hypothetical protein